MVPPASHRVSRVPWYSGYCHVFLNFAYGALTLFGRLSQNRSAIRKESIMQSATPQCLHRGLGSFPFARRYLENRCFFLFLALLRCFSSGGSLPYVMDWRMDDRGSLCRVSPFGYLRIDGYLLLPEAFRSLSRPSSALSAKASTLRSFCLTFRPRSSGIALPDARPQKPSAGFLRSIDTSGLKVLCLWFF